MFNWFYKTFILPASASRLAESQTADARVLALAHRAKAEEHLALAEMFERRVTRLDIPAEPLEPFPQLT